jgi:hypothetical protein
VDPERQRLGISMRPGAADFNVGDEVTGKVRSEKSCRRVIVLTVV